MSGVDGFIKTALASGVLERQHVDEAIRHAPFERLTDASAFARYLVKSGRLTKFQAARLLKGKTTGLRVAGYLILAPIGKGGIGRVYIARDTVNQRLVALKVLSPKKMRQDERYLSRFLREMEMCQRVKHPSLAAVYDVGISQGFHFIAMEYVPGKNLYRLVRIDGPLPVPRAARLFADVALVLEHAHRQKIIHRDLKPSNIIITPEDRAKLVDLGMAIIEGEPAGNTTVTGGSGYVMGSMDYLAPEQADNAVAVDARADVYGLGCALYFAVTGSPPFPGGTAVQKIQRHKSEKPVPASRKNRSVPPTFDVLLNRMMAKRPADRLQSAAAVREHLLVWADLFPGQTAPTMPLPEESVAELDSQGPVEVKPVVQELPNRTELATESSPVREEISSFEDRPVGIVRFFMMAAAAIAIAVIGAFAFRALTH
jgi:serine/threonine protein kinase